MFEDTQIKTLDVLPYEAIVKMRKEDEKHHNPYKIIAQAGGQERMLSTSADILIGGGCRGGSKSFSLMMEALKDVYNKRFSAIIMRHEINDLQDLIDTSPQLYGEFGKYNRSKGDMTWNFDAGGKLEFSYHADAIDEFKIRFQGHQYAYIGIDEITHMDYAKFKYMITCNRNAYHIRNRVIGTCNPDPDSWVAKFIEWWIGEDGYPIPERDGVIRYCFMPGDDVTEIYWGNTRMEVYEQCKDIIDKYWTEDLHKFGNPEDLFIKSVTFIEAKLADNMQLMRSDPTYLANLANQSEEQRARDLAGNWKFRSVGDDMIKLDDINKFFDNSYQLGDNIRRCSCDVALEGGDSLVMWLWIGNHIKDVFVCKLDSQRTVKVVTAKLEEWHVRQENFVYDVNGLGQIFRGFFRKAVPFNNKEAVMEKYKFIYGNLKSQAAYMFATKLKDGEISIESEILTRRFSGKGFANMMLKDVLNKERKAIRKDEHEEDKGWTIIRKAEMKKLVGHSPDFIEALLMRMIFDIKFTGHHKPKGILKQVHSRMASRFF